MSHGSPTSVTTTARRDRRRPNVEFIGHVRTNPASELSATVEREIDLGYLDRIVRAHEDAGFDRVLIDYVASQPDGLQVAAYAASRTQRLGFLVAHRPGFVFPTLAARAFATADQLSGGRIALHAISGGASFEQRRDGDYLSKDDRYARTAEYLQILRRAWTQERPFDHHGRFYRFEDFVSDVKPWAGGTLPIYFGGASEVAYEVGARHADVYALFGEPLASTADQIDRIRRTAQAAGRAEPPRIIVSFRPILGATEQLAWERARAILHRVKDRLATGGGVVKRLRHDGPKPVSLQRLVDIANVTERYDRALWTAFSKATDGAGNDSALVGTPETVAAALMDYVDLGVSGFIIRGFSPYDDAIDYGRHLLPLVRQQVGGAAGGGPEVRARAG